MISRFREIENSYIENFSESKDKGDYIIFRDDKLPDMHAFNCMLVKDNMNEDSIEDFVADSLNQAKLSGKDFLTIIFHPQIKIKDRLIECLVDMGFDIENNLYLEIEGSKADGFKANDECVVKIASTNDGYEAARALDIKTCITKGIPLEFAQRKTLRKKEVFQNPNKKLYLYLCYFENDVVGKCELHVKDEHAKIEDFEVLDKYQRRGFGTAILKRVISDAVGLGMKNIYLIADKDDTPREMYVKLGFELIGEEFELFWSKQK